MNDLSIFFHGAYHAERENVDQSLQNQEEGKEFRKQVANWNGTPELGRSHPEMGTAEVRGEGDI